MSDVESAPDSNVVPLPVKGRAEADAELEQAERESIEALKEALEELRGEIRGRLGGGRDVSAGEGSAIAGAISCSSLSRQAV